MKPSASPVLGPYILNELLGSSERTMVWRATQRETGDSHHLCLPRTMPQLRQSLERWQDAVRTAARRPHPQVLALQALDVSHKWPYAAFSSQSQTLLSAHLAELAEPPEPRVVVGWLCDVLEGLAHLHDGGAAHHDLEPFNVSLDGRGHAHLIGSGVAGLWDTESAERGRGGSGAVSSIEALSLWSQRGAAARDVLCAGVLLHRLLGGAKGGFDVAEAVRRLPDQPLLLQETPHPVNQALRSIVDRATHANPKFRYGTARALLRALQGWQDVADAEQSTFFQQLAERCNRDGLLPARPHTKGAVYRAMDRSNLTLGELSDAVSQDLALSLELLRQVNTIEFSGLGGGPVIAVSRAIALVGLNGVRTAVQQLREQPGHSPETRTLERSVERAVLAGYLAEELLPPGMGSEVAVLAGMLHNLGRVLVACHFPREAEQIADLVQTIRAPDEPPLTESEAAATVIGCDYADLGRQIAQAWHVPHDLQAMMVGYGAKATLAAPGDADAMLRMVAVAANEFLEMLAQPDVRARQAGVKKLMQRFGRHLQLDDSRLQQALQRARERAARASGVSRAAGVRPGTEGDWRGQPVAAGLAVTPTEVSDGR